MSDQQKTIAVIGATGMQGGGVVDALLNHGGFHVRALTRRPDAYDGPAHEARKADLDDPDTLANAFEGAWGVFVVTNFWEDGTDEVTQGNAAVRAAEAAGVSHFIWSTLPDVKAISDGKWEVPHFSNKAQVNGAVAQAGFAHHTFVEAPFYFQNLTGVMGPQPLPNGGEGWAMPLDPDAEVIHAGDITELGRVVAGAFANPEAADGKFLSAAGDTLSFGQIVETLNGLGHDYAYRQVPAEVYADFYPGAEEMAQMMGYWSDHSYMGPGADVKLALAKELATAPLTDFATWAAANMAP